MPMTVNQCRKRHGVEYPALYAPEGQAGGREFNCVQRGAHVLRSCCTCVLQATPLRKVPRACQQQGTVLFASPAKTGCGIICTALVELDPDGRYCHHTCVTSVSADASGHQNSLEAEPHMLVLLLVTGLRVRLHPCTAACPDDTFSHLSSVPQFAMRDARR